MRSRTSIQYTRKHPQSTNFSQGDTWRTSVKNILKRKVIITTVGPPYCQAEMYAGCIACCPLVSHGEYAYGTDRQTPDRYIMLSARRSQRNNNNTNNNNNNNNNNRRQLQKDGDTSSQCITTGVTHGEIPMLILLSPQLVEWWIFKTSLNSSYTFTGHSNLMTCTRPESGFRKDVWGPKSPVGARGKAPVVGGLETKSPQTGHLLQIILKWLTLKQNKVEGTTSADSWAIKKKQPAVTESKTHAGNVFVTRDLDLLTQK